MADKKYEESSKIIRNLIAEGKIKKTNKERYVFFISKAMNSIAVSERLFRAMEEEELDTSMWVINSAYYSMFYCATALLAKHNHKIDSEIGIHKLTYHALVHYFINEENKISKQIMEDYENELEKGKELMQFSDMNKLFDNYSFELNKRKIFTYETGKTAQKSQAKTSLNRAKEFINFIKDICQ